MGIKLGNIDAKYIKVGSDDCKVYLGNILVYSGGTPHDYSQDYFTVRVLEDFDIVWGGMPLSYSIDGGTTWSEPSSDIILSAFTSGSTVMFKGNVEPIGDSIGRFNPYGNGKFEVEGNIMSLIFGDNFVGQTDLTGYNKVFSNMFFVGKKIKTYSLISAENLVLPATTLSSDCYAGMFYGCAALVTPPKILPATTLPNPYQYGCYCNMFASCESLTTAPVLPATTLANNCYSGMFKGCTSLTTAPILPATTLVVGCYGNMFQGCTSLTTAPVLPATTLADSCYYYMFQGCTSLTTAPVLPATTLANSCYCYMFNGCTSLTTAPVLPATTLANNCYSNMFRNCTSLNGITCLATDISATRCTNYWVKGVAASGTFYKASSMSSWATGDAGIPSGWTVQDYSS